MSPMPHKDPEARRLCNRRNYLARREQRIEVQRQWRIDNPGRTEAWKRANPDRVKAYQAASDAKYREKRLADSRAYHAARRVANLEQMRATARRNKMAWKYGISEADYDAFAAAQGNGCAVCHAPLPLNRSGHIDHDHNTGTVRGLLCMRCNVGIGNLRDDPEILASAIDYLQKAHRSQLTLVKKEIS
jgi:hypothetical protein